MQLHADNITSGPAYRHGMPARLGGFIALSLVAHVLLLLNYQQSALMPMESRLGSTAIHISLRDAVQHTTTGAVAIERLDDTDSNDTTPTKSSVPTQLHAAATQNAVMEKPVPVRQPSTAQATSRIAPSEAASNTVQHNPTATPVGNSKALAGSTEADIRQSNNRETQRNYLLGQIHNMLSRHLSYPLRARRRGWEGEVLVGFHISREGLLNNIHLARSSGYALLDRSAMAALRKVKTIPLQGLRQRANAVFQQTDLQAMDLQLPIIYQLHEG